MKGIAEEPGGGGPRSTISAPGGREGRMAGSDKGEVTTSLGCVRARAWLGARLTAPEVWPSPGLLRGVDRVDKGDPGPGVEGSQDW